MHGVHATGQILTACSSTAVDITYIFRRTGSLGSSRRGSLGERLAAYRIVDDR
jgi:hypothetical protein